MSFLPYLGTFTVIGGTCAPAKVIPQTITVSYEKVTAYPFDGERSHGENQLRIEGRGVGGVYTLNLLGEEFLIEGEGRFSEGAFIFSEHTLEYRWDSNAVSKNFKFTNVGNDDLTFEYSAGGSWTPGYSCKLRLLRL